MHDNFSRHFVAHLEKSPIKWPLVSDKAEHLRGGQMAKVLDRLDQTPQWRVIGTRLDIGEEEWQLLSKLVIT